MSALCCNMLLAQLPDSLLVRLQAQAKVLMVRPAQELVLADQSSSYVYFPQTALLSLVHTLMDSSSTEVMMIGREGMLASHQDNAAINMLHGRVLRAGSALQISRGVLAQLAVSYPELQAMLTAYTDDTLRQLCQVVACYRHHSVKQQLSRWLLAFDDHYPNQPILTTHAAMAARLGVRREAVSNAASALQEAGALHYHRGQVEHINRPLLLTYSCECYHPLQSQYKKTRP
ncbi:Crp/Fnr family transcriptional regulator [Aliidiomarina sedimenti]|nr:Crp/Fnr family transcriptional regulator [Aliidiomarina sedimenti]